VNAAGCFPNRRDAGKLPLHLPDEYRLPFLVDIAHMSHVARKRALGDERCEGGLLERSATARSDPARGREHVDKGLGYNDIPDVRSDGAMVLVNVPT
jgi:hypothetical protein